ncbi:L,D-transpeptidase [Legionella sp. CNM-4043-24]|uniref:L,D-transpeptidase n=1 Tax=Legionella sp. CNM-4043-24 TaxID=3421646 RepID=UPI00403A7C9B
MKHYVAVAVGLLFICQNAWCIQRYGERICHEAPYRCQTIKRGDSWAQLFPDPVQRDLVKRVNRMNVFLQPDMIIAVPKNLASVQVNDLAPFAQTIKADGDKRIIINLAAFAWAAYNEQGHLLKWGPISPGAKKCLDIAEGCTTPEGEYYVTRKDGEDCLSKSYPHRISGVRGGGEMPWCIYFYKGYALHGSSELPGYEASYGCVRMLVEDAEWLNRQFVDLPTAGKPGTRVIIKSS